MDMIGDIVEKEVKADDIKPPAPPNAPNTERPRKQSRWKQRQQQQQQTHSQPAKPPPTTAKAHGPPEQDKLSTAEQIHLENVRRIADMTPEEYEQEKEELFGSMDPNVLQALLRRAESRENNEPMDSQKVDAALGVSHNLSKEEPTTLHSPEESVKGEDETATEPSTLTGTENFLQQDDNIATPDTIETGNNEESTLHFTTHGGVNATGELDITDPEFDKKLHEKYFPNFESEPEKLAWMKPVEDEETVSYDPQQDSLAPSELRFDFRGDLLSPRQSIQIDPYVGLHHHGDAPHAAGYTVGELAHLARSSVAAQRCIAIQTLGRILFKIGKAVYGKEISDELWRVVEYGRVLDTLHEASDENITRSMNVRAYAVEALWLWKQGGAKRKAV